MNLGASFVPKFYGVGHLTDEESSFVVLDRVSGVELSSLPLIPYKVRLAASRSLAKLHMVGIAHGDVRFD